MSAATPRPQARTLHRLRQLWGHFQRRRRLQFAGLAALMLFSALADVVSVGAVIPFLTVLAAPEKLLAYPALDVLRRAGGGSTIDLATSITLVFIVATLVAATVRLLLVWGSARIGFAAGADLSIEVYRRTLYQPYDVHIHRNSSEVISGIVEKVNAGVAVIMSTIALLSAAILVIAVVTALLAIDPHVAALAATIFGGSYALIARAARRRVAAASRRVADEQTRIVQALQEGLGGIRDVLLDGTQAVYCDIYRAADAPLRRDLGRITFIGQSPRYAMEAFGAIVVALLALALSRGPEGLVAAVPVLGALALGAQRLLPSLQQVYHSWVGITGNMGALDDLLRLLAQPLPAGAGQPLPEPRPLRQAIELRNVSFRYSEATPWVLHGVDITIRRGSRAALVGPTGSGKSTVIDLLLGLLAPTQGLVLADGVPIAGAHARAWQQTIAHVPQSIFLADTTIASNIAFGVPEAAVDMHRVRSAARQAHLADFIDSCPDGYLTRVGERGVRLSGGQRQRIGIARALYKRANVLVFDEATSALDNATEHSIMETIRGLSRDLTIILVAHRLSTVRHCETIFELAGGRVVAQGSFDSLIETSPTFRRLASVA